MNFKWATIDTSSAATSEAKRATTIQAFIDLYNGVSNPNIKEGNSILGSETRYITQEQFNFIKSGGGKDTNAISYLKSLPNMSKQDLLDSMKKNDNQNNGTVIVDNGGSSSSSSNSIQSNHGSSASNSLGSTSASNSNLGSSNSIGSNSVSSSSSSSSDAKGAAYEINQQASSSSGINSNNLIYAIILVLIIGAFAGFGFIKTRKNE
jgi:cobalamin biosynthesis Mg chelatase CobN